MQGGHFHIKGVWVCMYVRVLFVCGVQELAADLAGKYDTIFLTTPHGLALQQLPLLYLNPSVKGVASLGIHRQ